MGIGMKQGGIRRIVIGLDGSAPSRRAIAFVSRLAPPPGGRVLCVSVLEPTRLPSMPLVPDSVRGVLVGQARAVDRRRAVVAQRELDAAVARLKRAGWRARGEIRMGVPLPGLLAAAKGARADVLVLGAKGVTGAARVLLGSVADGALKQSPVAVLIVP
jgi:nucleotide-binding universal stress UspA family protein